MKITNFALIIGAMKCGTTSLYNYLCQHPEIASPIFKEPNFFSYDERWNNGWEWYLSRWKDWNSQQHKIAIEASVNYTKNHAYPYTVSRIQSMTKRAKFKFIYIVRDPIERIESHYTHAQAAPWGKNLKSFNEGIDIDLIETSKYAQQIEQYYKLFPKQDILIINFDEIKYNPEQILKQVCVFLEINPSYQFKNSNKVYNSSQSHIIDVKYWRLLRKIKLLKKISNIIPATQKQYFRLLIGGNKIEKNFSLSTEQKEDILAELNEDIIKFSEKYHVDISGWLVNLKKY